MSEQEQNTPGPGATPPPPPDPAPSGGGQPKPDPVESFKAMPGAEKLLCLAAVAVLLGFIFAGYLDNLFQYRWFPTTAFLGSVLVIVLIALDLFGVRWVDAKLRIRILIALAALPALGFLIDQLQNFWRALMLAGAVVMIVAAVRLTAREGLLKR